jgi:hypothetical protein
MKVIDVEGLPDEIVQALEQIVQALRERVGLGQEAPRRQVDLPVWPGTVLGRLTREEIYEDQR